MSRVGQGVVPQSRDQAVTVRVIAPAVRRIHDRFGNSGAINPAIGELPPDCRIFLYNADLCRAGFPGISSGAGGGGGGGGGICPDKDLKANNAMIIAPETSSCFIN